MINSDKEFLNWIYERMICVHGERDMYDYMINFKSIIDRQDELTSLHTQLMNAKEDNKQLLKAIESLSPTVKLCDHRQRFAIFQKVATIAGIGYIYAINYDRKICDVALKDSSITVPFNNIVKV